MLSVHGEDRTRARSRSKTRDTGRERSRSRQPDPPSSSRRERSSTRQRSSPSPPARPHARHASTSLEISELSISSSSRRSHSRQRGLPDPPSRRRQDDSDDDAPRHGVSESKRAELKRMISTPNREPPPLTRAESHSSQLQDENYSRPTSLRQHSSSISSSLVVPGAASNHKRRMSTSGLPPGSPLLEAYKGTYQMISPRPSPMVRPGDDHSDISDLDFTLDSDDDDSDIGGEHEHSTALVATRSRSSASQAVAVRSRKSTLGKEDLRHICNDISRACKKKDNYDPVFLEVLPRKTQRELMDIRDEYRRLYPAGTTGKGINVTKQIKAAFSIKEPYNKALWYTSLGQWESEANWANTFYQDSNSKNELVIEALAGRSNSEIFRIKQSFLDSKYNNSLEKCIIEEFPTTKFKKAILLILRGERDPEDSEVRTSEIKRDADEVHHILSNKGTTNSGESELVQLIVERSDRYLKELGRQYQNMYGRKMEDAILARSKNLVGELLVHMIAGARDPVGRDAKLLHACLKGNNMDLIISRCIRVHWDRDHLEEVKTWYEKQWGGNLTIAATKNEKLMGKCSDLGEYIVQMLRTKGSK